MATWLAAATMEWRASADPVARRMVDKGIAPDGRVRSLAQDIPLNWVPEGRLSAAEVARLLGDRLRGLTASAKVRPAVRQQRRGPTPSRGRSCEPASPTGGTIMPVAGATRHKFKLAAGSRPCRALAKLMFTICEPDDAAGRSGHGARTLIAESPPP